MPITYKVIFVCVLTCLARKVHSAVWYTLRMGTNACAAGRGKQPIGAYVSPLPYGGMVHMT